MSTESPAITTSRREFLKSTGTLAAAGALAGVTLPHVHAAENNTIKIALIGAGGRGSGAAANAMTAKNGPVKLVAMADVFPDKLKASYEGLQKQFGDKVDVPKERQFIGFDGYEHAMDSLGKGDIVIFATPPAFRWVFFKRAIEKGLNIFMEKPVAVDAPTAKRMMELSDEADKKGIKVGVGLMCRHCRARQELHKKIQDGAIGQIITMRSYRMHGPTGSAFSQPMPDSWDSELLWQISRFHSFLWASGGCFSDFYIHNIDECCWMKNSWPVQAQASGGRNYRGDYIDQNFDTYSVEYTFADGTKYFHFGRTMAGCHDEFASYAHGQNGLAVISSEGHWPSKARIYKTQKMANSDIVWRVTKEQEGPTQDPYLLEWEDLIDAVRNNTPYNEAKRGAQASLVTAMGRFAAHTGQVVTYDDYLKNPQEFAPKVNTFDMKSPPPLLSEGGKYPIPRPGLLKDREY
ncbi:MAG TPA: Gfo/Idh/MocA family oxidoreductase [Verrucomicrobiota bacterium]|nr:Gfo/Idh/MocA family oxidoreductase [Verrucomicrobiota bacterium]